MQETCFGLPKYRLVNVDFVANRLGGKSKLIVIMVHKDSGTELLKETAWEGEAPHKGDVMELHCGETSRWIVEEVDWVFDDAPKEDHDNVPLKHIRVVVMPFDASTGKELDPLCVCGHKESLHSPNGCTGRSHTCDCPKFTMH